MENVEFPSVKEFAYEADRTKRMAKFMRFKDENLFYSFKVNEVKYEFPIPIADANGGEFKDEEYATMLKRFYIKSLKESTVRIA